MYGPMQLVVVTFDNPNLPMDLRNQLKAVLSHGFVRLLDAVFVSKDQQGDLMVLEGSDLNHEEAELLGFMAGAFFGYGAAGTAGIAPGADAGLAASEKGAFGLSEDDLLEIADMIPTGSAAVFVLLEHLWARGLREAVENSEGTVVANGWITPATLVAMGANAAGSAL